MARTASGAYNSFHNGKFEDAAQICKALEANAKEYDVKLIYRMNEAVAQYHAEGNTTSSVQTLMEAMSNSNMGIEDFVSWTHTYNKALAFYQANRPMSAWELLQKIVDSLEAVEVYVAIHACFLALDVCFKMRMLDKPAVQKVIMYLDKAVAELKDVKKEGDVSFNLYPSVSRLKLQVKFYKAHLHLMLRGDKQNVKALPVSDFRDSPTQFYNARLALEQCDFEGTVKAVSAAKSYFESDFPSPINAANQNATYHNTLGLAFLQAGKFAVAQSHFLSALDADKKTQKESKRFSRCDIESSVMYNLALSLVARGNLAESFSLLSSLDFALSNSPLYWMRLGECTVLNHVRTSNSDRPAESRTSWDVPSSHLLRQQFVSSHTLPGSRLILPLDESLQFSYKKGAYSPDRWKIDPPSLELSYGQTCFSNMLQLLSLRADREAASSAPTTSGPGDQLWIDWKKSKQDQARSLQLIARVHLAWIALKMNDPLRARKHTIKAMLLANTIVPEVTSVTKLRNDAVALTPYKLLAFLYHAEANLRLDKVNVAIQSIEEYIKLHADNDSEILKTLWQQEGEPIQMKINIAESREAIYSNLAAAFLVQNNVEQARIFARKCVEEQIASGPSLRVTLLQIYIMLTEGQVSEVLEMLAHEQFAPVARFVVARANPLT